MRCAVTGKDTNNKWRGFAVCKEIVERAKDMESDPKYRGWTMRRRLIRLQSDWKAENQKKVDVVTEDK